MALTDVGPEDQTPRFSPGEFLSGVIFTLLVLLTVWILFLSLKSYYYDSNFLPVDTISIKGGLDHNSIEEISTKLSSSGVMVNFIKLDVDEVQRMIEEIPWVQSVSVRKQWPSYLYLNIVEKIPQARWGERQLYSQSAGVFTGPDDRNYDELVLLDGPEEKADLVYAGYRKYQQFLARYGFIIDAARVSDRRSWEIDLKNGPRLILGREVEEIDSRLERFVKIYSLIQNQDLIAYIDLRYDNGLAVGWKNLPEDGKVQRK